MLVSGNIFYDTFMARYGKPDGAIALTFFMFIGIQVRAISHGVRAASPLLPATSAQARLLPVPAVNDSSSSTDQCLAFVLREAVC